MLFTAATDLKGAHEAIEALATLAPSPAQRLESMLDGSAPPIDGPVVAQVFKTLADPFVGKVSMIRLFAGQIDGDAQLVDQRTGQTERLANIQFATERKVRPLATWLLATSAS